MAAARGTGAMEQDGVRGKRAGDIVVGPGAIGLLPANSGGSVDTIGGRVHATDSASPQLDLTYFATPHVAFNLITATTEHDISVQGSPAGQTLPLGHVWALPPTLT